MENNLQIKVDKFIDTYATIKKHYKWSVDDFSLRFMALIYFMSNKEFNKDELDDTMQYIKKNSKWFSYYRGHQKFSTAALLVTKFEDFHKAFDDLLENEDKLTLVGFKKSPYLSIAAYALLLTGDSENIDIRAHRAMELYKEMKKKHFWLTGYDDYPLAILLSESDKDTNVLISEIESNYDMLHREGFGKTNGLQFLSHLLTFSPESANIKAQKTKNIYDRLKKERFHVSSTYYGTLGYLTLLGEFSEQATEEVIDVVRYLKSNKDFKWVYKDMNVLAATALASSQYIEKLSQENDLIEAGIGISIEAMIAAQTAALIAMTSATAATTAASSGS